MRPITKVKAIYLYPRLMDFRESIEGRADLVELDIKVSVFGLVLFVFLNKARIRVKIFCCERNGFCLWIKRLHAERVKTNADEPIMLTVRELNQFLAGFDHWGNQSHKVLTPRFVS